MLNVEEIRKIIKMVDESSINEFSYETEGATVTMKKASVNNVVTQVSNNAELMTEQPVYVAQETLSLTEEAKAVQVDQTNSGNESSVQYDFEICSPMVGTLYNAPSPENDPYVEVGSVVKKDSIVCIVEAMKLFNEIEAEVSGEIVEILVGNGELVEYGQPLFRVKKK